jgi:hypothetical protein
MNVISKGRRRKVLTLGIDFQGLGEELFELVDFLSRNQRLHILESNHVQKGQSEMDTEIGIESHLIMLEAELSEGEGRIAKGTYQCSRSLGPDRWILD